MEKLTLALTNYNRYDLLLESFVRVSDDDRITEIIISDDCSEYSIYEEVRETFRMFPKIKLYRNEENIGMLKNKKRAVELSSSNWVILFDSDNVINTDYLDALERIPLTNDIIYCPSGALPNFNYSRYAGNIYNFHTVKKHLREPMFNCLLNTANYVVPRDKYLEVFKENSDIKGTDTIWFNYLWLQKGNRFYVVPGMKYKHLVHDGSEFLKDTDYNMAMAETMKKRINAL